MNSSSAGKVKTCLWFNGGVEDAIARYQALFGSAFQLGAISHYPENAPGVPGSVLMAEFVLFDHHVQMLNGGPHYTLTPAVSLAVSCDSQEEVDRYWYGLLEGGEPSQCGWLTDAHGVSWQIVPRRLGELMSDPDPEKSARVMQAMLQMVRLDIPTLEAAYRGELS